MLTRNRFVALAATGLLSAIGCAGKAKIQSHKRADFDGKLERVLIVFTPERLGKDFEAAFKPRFAEALAARGVESRYAVTQGALALDSAPSLEKQAREFQASSILALLAAGGTVNTAGGVVRAKLDGKIMDLSLGKLVWRAQIEYVPGGTLVPVEQRADVLIREILTALVADGLVAGPPPGAPDSPAASPSR